MTIEYVKVPKALLEQLELDRQDLYELFDEMEDKLAANKEQKTMYFIRLQNLTNRIWRLANKKWDAIEKENVRPKLVVSNKA